MPLALIPRKGCLSLLKSGKTCRRRSLRVLALWRPWCAVDTVALL
jgi:hypothetical protein